MNDRDLDLADLANTGELSTCCGAHALGDVHKSGDDLVGICSDCRDHAMFEEVEE
jgi:hypothetical protein